MENPAPTTAKEPWLAALLATMWPGIGHIYIGKRVLGFALAIGYLVLSILALYLLSSRSITGLAPVLPLPILILTPLLSPIFAFIQARRNNPPEFEQDRRLKKDPWLAVFLSFLLPGLGFFFIKSWARGLAAFALFFIALFIIEEVPTDALKLILSQVASFVVAIFTYRDALAFRPSHVQHPHRILITFALYFALLVCAMKLFRAEVAEPYTISGSSMEPVIQKGDRIVVSKKFDRNALLGALVVYASPEGQSDWIKRVVALPGDRVEIRDDNRMYINDVLLAVAPFTDAVFDKTQPASNSSSYWKIPQGHVFVLGDNPDRSIDSRRHGPIDIQSIRGIACKIIWPVDRAGPIK